MEYSFNSPKGLIDTMLWLEKKLKKELNQNGRSFKFILIQFDLSQVYMQINKEYGNQKKVEE